MGIVHGTLIFEKSKEKEKFFLEKRREFLFFEIYIDERDIL